MMLSPSEKGFYRNKVEKNWKIYEQLRHRFFAIENIIDRLFKDGEIERNSKYRLRDGLNEAFR